MQVESLREFTLAWDHIRSTEGGVVVDAVGRVGRRHKWLQDALLEIDAETKVLRKVMVHHWGRWDSGASVPTRRSVPTSEAVRVATLATRETARDSRRSTMVRASNRRWLNRLCQGTSSCLFHVAVCSEPPRSVF